MLSVTSCRSKKFKVSDWVADWSMFVGIDADVQVIEKIYQTQVMPLLGSPKVPWAKLFGSVKSVTMLSNVITEYNLVFIDCFSFVKLVVK